MKPLIILLVSILATFLMIVSFSNSQQYSPSIPNVTLENNMLDIANAVLPNNQPVWCKEKYEYALEQFKYHFVENESNIDNNFIQGII